MGGTVDDVIATPTGALVVGTVDEGCSGTVVVWADDRPLGACRVDGGRWELDAATERWSSPVTVRAALVDGDRLVHLRALTTEVREPALRGWVDGPAHGTELRTPLLRVTGWLVPGTGFRRLDVDVAGVGCVAARCFANAREDLEAFRRSPTAAVAGWEASVAVPSDVPDGAELELTVTAVGADWTLPLEGAGAVVVRRAVADEVPAPASAAPRAVTSPVVVVHTHDLAVGGAQLHLLDHLRALAGAGRHRFVVVPQGGGPLQDAFAEVAEVWPAVGQPPAERSAYERHVQGLEALLSAAGSDVVVANTAGAFPLVDSALRSGRRSMWTILENVVPDTYLDLSSGGDEWVRARLRACVDGADALLFDARATMAAWRTASNADRCSVTARRVAANAIGAAATAPTRADARAVLGFADDDVVVLCVGTVESRKNQAALTVAFAEVASRHPRATLALVGDIATPYSAAIRRTADRLGLGDRVRLEPPDLDIGRWYAAADVFVLASDLESMPRTLMEAMAHGRAVVVTDVGDMADVVADGTEGLVVPRNDFGALVDALDRMLARSADERDAMGAAGRRRIEGEAARARTAATWQTVLDEVARRP